MTEPAGSMPAHAPALADEGLVADGRSAALISREGAIDWACMPRIDRAPCFDRLLDAERGGTCTIAPAGRGWRTRRGYEAESLVLTTRFESAEGEALLRDGFLTDAMGAADLPGSVLGRCLLGIAGELAVAVCVRPRFEFGRVDPWLRPHDDGRWVAYGGPLALVVGSNVPLHPEPGGGLAAALRLRPGQRRALWLAAVEPERVDEMLERGPAPARLDALLGESAAGWRRWSEAAPGARLGPRARQSARVVKGLAHPETGAIVAAATTSIPEQPDGSGSWDYRYSWIRDASFAVHALLPLGYDDVARGFRRFLERAIGRDPSGVQVAYAVGGGHRLPEHRIHGPRGYHGAPVREGNAAAGQLQLDIYGELFETVWRCARAGLPPGEAFGACLAEIADQVTRLWHEPDRGIWEERGEPRHFVHSKASCWTALERALQLDLAPGDERRRAHWAEVRDAIRHEVETRGYDEGRGVFVRAYDSDELDAALLLLPRTDLFLARDERMVRTVHAIREELCCGPGLLRRHRDEKNAFTACGFWMAENLARQGALEEAAEWIAAAERQANELGLFSEMLDPTRGEALGNFPQGLGHYSHLSALLALDEARRGADAKETG